MLLFGLFSEFFAFQDLLATQLGSAVTVMVVLDRLCCLTECDWCTVGSVVALGQNARELFNRLRI